MQVVLTVTEGPHRGRSFAFDRHDTFLVGRAPMAHFRLPKKDPHFSRLHFLVEVNPPCCRLIDLNSRNGTFINGRRVVQPVDLCHDDRIEGGNTAFRVSIDPPPSAPTVIVPPELLPRPAAAQAFEPERRQAAAPDALPVPAPDAPRSPRPATPAPVPAPAPAPPEASPDELAEPDLDSADPGSLPPDYLDRIAAQPQPIPGYLLVDELGSGGMGVVHRAICRADGGVVALKMVKPAVSVKPRDLERFLREAEILKRLSHPNIVGFRELGEAGGRLYFVMEYVPGTDAARLRRQAGGLLPIRQAVGIICQLLSGLEYAHAQGFVHRDIKPANLLLTRAVPVAGPSRAAAPAQPGRALSGTASHGRTLVKLADFGLARAYQTSQLSGLTMMGDIAGTAPFMPPEQITNFREAQPAADQFSAAATLYVLLTGRPIHDFPDDVREQLLMILTQDAVSIQSRRPEIPDSLAAAVHRALSREPEARFAGVGEFREALVRPAEAGD